MAEYTISQLEQMTKLTRRTIHYYAACGIIPPAVGKGAKSTYDERHLNRLLLTIKMQKMNMTLEQIRILLSTMTEQEVEAELRQNPTEQDSVHRIKETVKGLQGNESDNRVAEEEKDKKKRAAFPLTDHLELVYYEPVDRQTVELMYKIKQLCQEEMEREKEK